MKVIYDHQAFSFQEYGGISRYFSELIKFFRTKNIIETEILISYSNNQYLSDIVKVKTFFPWFRFKGRNKIIEYLNRSASVKRLREPKDYTIFHPTYYDPYFLKAIGDIPFILTIHDMAHEHYPGSFSRLDFTAKNKKILASKAARIIAISEFTKKDIIETYNIQESMIDVIYHASSFSLKKKDSVNISLPDDYILFVGKRNTYKNFLFFLRATQKVLSLKSNYYIVCAGGGRFNKSEAALIDELKLSDKIIQLPVDDNLLACIYSRAKVFVFPSLYEGFGIPVLEAFANGCPAVLSNNTALPEVGGDAALYFNPQNEENLISVLLEVLEKEDLRKDLIEREFKRAELFSWEKTAEMTLNTYKKITGKY
jgi:glycosyltransferase involved in cell wall biosynthesis